VLEITKWLWIKSVPITINKKGAIMFYIRMLKIFKITFGRICMIYLFTFSVINSQGMIVNNGETVNITASTAIDSLTNYGTILLNNNRFTVSGNIVNNGIIDLGSSSGQLIFRNSNEQNITFNGDNSLRGNIILDIYAGNTKFYVNGENPNFTGYISMIGSTTITLNSTKGLGDVGDMVFGSVNQYLVLNIEGNQTWNKPVSSYAYSVNINKTGSGDLYFGNSSLNGAKSGVLTVFEGNAYINPLTYRFATTVYEGANVYFGLTKDSSLASSIGGSGDIFQNGDFTLYINGDNREFNGTYHINEGGLIFTDTAAPKPIEFNADIIANANSYVGGYVNINADVTLKSGSALFAGDISRAKGYEFHAKNIYFEDESRYEVYTGNNQSGIITAGDVISIGDNVSLFIKANPDNSSEWNPFTYHTIARAYSIEGEFGNITTDLAFLDPYLKYTNTAVMLILKRNDIAFNALEGLNTNQASTAAAIESIGFYDGNNAILTKVFGSNVTNAKELFDSLSGEFYASSLSIQKQNANEIKDLLLNRISSYSDNAKYQNWVDIWGRNYKGADGDFHDIKSNSYGILTGFDSFKDEDTLFGLSVGYEHTNSKITSLSSDGKINSFYLLAYIDKKFNSFSIKGGVGGGLSKIEANRYVKEFDDTINVEYGSYTVQLFTQALKEFEINENLKLSPYIGASYLILNTEGFSEKGKTAALKVKNSSEKTGYISLGLKSLYDLKENISFMSSFGLTQAFGDTKGESEQSFVSGSDSFTIYGTPVAKTSVKVGLGLDFRLSSDLLINTSYEGTYAKEAKEHSAHLKLSYRF
jgi:uncharacterized protein with beta-barrel porin domain